MSAMHSYDDFSILGLFGFTICLNGSHASVLCANVLSHFLLPSKRGPGVQQIE